MRKRKKIVMPEHGYIWTTAELLWVDEHNDTSRSLSGVRAKRNHWAKCAAAFKANFGHARSAEALRWMCCQRDKLKKQQIESTEAANEDEQRKLLEEKLQDEELEELEATVAGFFA